MKIQQLRNATQVITFAGKSFLIDPMLAEKGAYPGIPGSRNSHLNNPLVGLPVPMSQILAVDAVIVTHLHPDHWDAAAKDLIPKTLPVFVQNEADKAKIEADGFEDVRVLTDATHFGEITLSKTNGQHGTDAAYEVMGDRLGHVSGVVFKHPTEKSLYVAGDTVWNHHVAQALEAHVPQVIVVNAGDAQFPALGSIIMTADDVAKVAEAAPEAQLVAAHMEAINHCMLSRADLRRYAGEKGFADRFAAPEDGETLTF